MTARRNRESDVLPVLGCLVLALCLDAARAESVSGPAAASATSEGIRLFDAGQNDAAEAQLLPAAGGAKPDPAACFFLGKIEMRRDRPKEAVAWFEKAVELEDANSTYHDWLGRAYGTQAQRASKLKQPFLAGKVKREFERAVALDPHNLDARENLISFYLQAPGIMGGSPEKAREQAQEIGKVDALRGYYATARVAEDVKDFAAAEEAYKAAVAAATDGARAPLTLGMFYARHERWDDAFRTFEALLEKTPDQPLALYQIGRTGAVSGQQLDRAAAALERYLTLPPEPQAPDAAAAHWRLGMVQEKRGDRERARAEYRKALELRPDFEDAKKSLAKLG